MLKEQITADLVTAMKAKDTVKLNTLRGIKTVFSEEEKKEGVVEVDYLAVLQKLEKSKVKALDSYKAINAATQIAEEEAELAILRAYLPAKKTAEEVTEIVNQLVKDNGYTEQKQVGQVMSYFNTNLSGLFESKDVINAFKNALANG